MGFSGGVGRGSGSAGSWQGGGGKGKDAGGWSRSNAWSGASWSGGGGGKGVGSSGSGGGEWGAKRALPKLAPRRGGGDWGKKLRQNEQQQIKDHKSQKEADYFWQQQEDLSRYVGGGGGAKGASSSTGSKAEERELFAGHTGSVGIDFDKYDGIDVEVSGKDAKGIEAISTFDELWEQFELPDFLWYNIERCKYSKPTPIQRHAIPVALSGRDAMCCAQTGSGKTCAFLLPILSCIDPAQATGSVGVEVGVAAAPKAVVLAPTRELCSQIHLEARKLAFQSPMRACEVYGGVEAKPQLLELARGVDVVTATPGRLIDFIDREVITMSAVGFLVLDEADRMLDMGFVPQIREIVQNRDMPSQEEGRMTLMFSATFPKEIQKLAQAFMNNYVWIGVGRVGGAAESVEQSFVITSNNAKPDALLKVMEQNPNDLTLIFVAMKRTAAWLEGHLRRNDYKAAAIHGDMEQRDRESSLSRFRSGQATFLVATDVAARGLDIPKVSHVINYDLPGKIEDYVHRIGRTGRIGNRGWATSFYVPASDSRHSNGNILKDLLSTLTSAGQEIPKEMQWEADKAGSTGAASTKGGGVGGGGSSGRSFGGRDIRGGEWGSTGGVGGYKSSSNGTYVGAGGGDRGYVGASKSAGWPAGGSGRW